MSTTVTNDQVSSAFNDTTTTEEEEIYVPKAILFAYVPVMISISIVGLIGNSLVVGAVIVQKQLQVLMNVFIVNLAFSDLMVASIVTPFVVVAAIDRGALYNNYPALCEVLGTFCIISFVSSIWNISFVALNRYIYICHRFQYSKIFTSRSVVGMVIFIWSFALLLDLPNYLGWGDHIFEARNFTCCYDYSANFAYTRGFLVTLGFIVPTCILNYSYIRIYLFAHNSTKQIAKHSERTPLPRHNIDDADKRLLQTIAIIWMVFMIMWMPYAISVLFNFGNIMPLFVPATALAFTNSSVNFLVYATNRHFKEGYLIILRKLMCCLQGPPPTQRRSESSKAFDTLDTIDEARKEATTDVTSQL